MVSQKIIDKVSDFVFQEEHSDAPILLSPENVAKLCYITVEDASDALKALGRQ